MVKGPVYALLQIGDVTGHAWMEHPQNRLGFFSRLWKDPDQGFITSAGSANAAIKPQGRAALIQKSQNAKKQGARLGKRPRDAPP